MKIRRYQKYDWNRICEIHDLARMDELRGANLEEAFLPLEVAAEREGLFDYDLLVADKDGLVLGFVAYGNDELTWLYVDPAFYRKGLGRLLARAALEERPGGLCIEVLKGNDAALDFYKSIGFVESRTVSGRMPGNETYPVVVHCLSYGSNA
ncbi:MULTISPECIES: N-acetyltransferase family protein [unclassified Luteimonas]